MNNLPKVVASAVPERESNLWPLSRLSDALPISPPSHHFITMTLNCDMFYSHILQATAWLRLGDIIKLSRSLLAFKRGFSLSEFKTRFQPVAAFKMASLVNNV